MVKFILRSFVLTGLTMAPTILKGKRKCQSRTGKKYDIASNHEFIIVLYAFLTADPWPLLFQGLLFRAYPLKLVVSKPNERTELLEISRKSL